MASMTALGRAGIVELLALQQAVVNLT